MDRVESERLIRLQVQMRADRDRLEAQAESLAAVWTGLMMDGGDVVVLLTDPDPHRAGLLALVEHPDRVQVRQSPYSSAELDEVYDAVLEIVQSRPIGPFRSYGHGLERGSIGLSSDQAALAAELHERFGDRLEIELGRHRYPLDATQVLEPDPPPTATIQLPELEMAVEPDRDTLASGEEIRGLIHLHNRTGDTLDVSTAHPALGVLISEHGVVVGTHPGLFAAVAGRITLEAGQREQIRFVAGSDTSDPRLGAALPTGTYDLVVTVQVLRPQDRSWHDLVTAPVPLRIQAPPM